MSRPAHTLEDFELELQSLRGAVLSMGRTALQMLETLGDMFLHTRSPDPSQAKAQERELDVSEVRVDEQARIILVKYQPVATDLREVTGALRISNDLERIGDEARKIVACYQPLLPWLCSDADGLLTKLWMLSKESLKDAVDAFSNHDAQLASKTLDRKPHLKTDCEQVLNQIAHKVSGSRALAPSFLDVVNAATGLQRIANSGLNIAEAVIFIETAQDVRHRHRQGED